MYPPLGADICVYKRCAFFSKIVEYPHILGANYWSQGNN